MAGYPPPYPPPPGSPYGFDPRQQARITRDQARAIRQQFKAQARAQRHIYRYQTRAYRRSSILGPLIILAIGVVALLMRLGRIPIEDFGVWYGRWWPVLLVGAGLVLVAEWAIDQIPRSDGTPYVRRGIGGGAIFLLILLALTGALAQSIRTYHSDLLNSISFNPEDITTFFGDKHDLSSTAESPFPAGSTLEIDNPHGNVTIVGKSGDGQLHITINKQIYSSSDSDANSKATRLAPQFIQTGAILRVILPSIANSISDLDITVPDSAPTTVTANHGDVAITGLHGPINVTANHGNIELNSITGTVSARINNRDTTFTAHQITGDLSVRGRADDVTATDVSGQVSLDGDFYGDAHFERLHGPVSFHTSRTQLALGRIDGQLTITPQSDLSGNQIAGPTLLKTRSRNINFDRVTGDIDITNSDGSVDVTGTTTLGSVTVENKNGEVNLTLPEHHDFTIDAQTRGGQIQGDTFGLRSTTEDGHASMTGTVGHGGPRISIRTTNLDINLNHRDLAPLTPPTPPAASGPSSRSKSTT